MMASGYVYVYIVQYIDVNPVRIEGDIKRKNPR